MDETFLSRLQCPITKSKLGVADSEQLKTVNARIESGNLKDHAGDAVDEPLNGMLVNADETFAYPMQDGIPTMIAERAIPLQQLHEEGTDT